MRRAVLILAIATASGCREPRSRGTETPTYDGAVSAILASRCKDCHDATPAPGGWRGGSYLQAIACVADGKPATRSSGGPAPLLRVLDDTIHAPLVTPEERATLTDWVAAGAPKFAGTVHESSFVDPRSPQSHGRALRSKGWRPMLDAKDPEACGRCHEGVARPEKATLTAQGAPACTTCHSEERGVLACGTCHAAGPQSFPPHDACFFPDDPIYATAHAAHAGATPSRAEGLACVTCHLAPPPEVIGGAHGNGKVEVVFDAKLAGAAMWSPQSGTCMAACHGGDGAAKPNPAWTDTRQLACGDCHGAPPPKHFAGACSGCHREANAAGTALTSPRLHVNGIVDLGDGSGKCGACHGKGDDPWPSTGAHTKHRAPSAAASVACATCHTVPTEFGPGTSHPRGGAPTVTLSGVALTKGAPATFEAGACKSVYCHGGNLIGTTPQTPVWADTSGAESKCGSCHGLPPGGPHIPAPKCALCHGSVAEDTAAGPRIIPAKAELHVNGQVNR